VRIKRHTARRVRYWVPRFRRADDDAVRAYHNFASALYVRAEANIIERVTGSEARRRSRRENGL